MGLAKLKLEPPRGGRLPRADAICTRMHDASAGGSHLCLVQHTQQHVAGACTGVLRKWQAAGDSQIVAVMQEHWGEHCHINRVTEANRVSPAQDPDQ